MPCTLQMRSRITHKIPSTLTGAETARLAPHNQEGATTLESALLLAAFVLPSYFIIKMLLGLLLSYYQMMTTLNSLPFP